MEKEPLIEFKISIIPFMPIKLSVSTQQPIYTIFPA